MGEPGKDAEDPHLQLLHLARPPAAFLAVDAADGQREDLLLQLRIWVDLRKRDRRNSFKSNSHVIINRLLMSLSPSVLIA